MCLCVTQTHSKCVFVKVCYTFTDAHCVCISESSKTCDEEIRAQLTGSDAKLNLKCGEIPSRPCLFFILTFLIIFGPVMLFLLICLGRYLEIV